MNQDTIKIFLTADSNQVFLNNLHDSFGNDVVYASRDSVILSYGKCYWPVPYSYKTEGYNLNGFEFIAIGWLPLPKVKQTYTDLLMEAYKEPTIIPAVLNTTDTSAVYHQGITEIVPEQQAMAMQVGFGMYFLAVPMLIIAVLKKLRVV